MCRGAGGTDRLALGQHVAPDSSVGTSLVPPSADIPQRRQRPLNHLAAPQWMAATVYTKYSAALLDAEAKLSVNTGKGQGLRAGVECGGWSG